ncbi:MAG: hypothetical protein II786_07280, partial [Muribaculaceae bacterium]|nr:hypothetical protein [Muribaculaceae bacterium]
FTDGEPQMANFVLEPDEMTAIIDVEAATIDRNAPIFDVMGRRVVGILTPGIYIQNGRKFFVK